ncbi:hypothetical protein [Streptomyces sp. NPDC001978]|uniref:hypothetical protein n=1 Tax=Streptomyces sp. NPDC001978 TaxID=3364627 RepID=UPI0036B8AD12
MATGRTNEPRTVTITTTSASTAITAGAGTFSAKDIGRTVTGTGISAGTTISAVASGTAATLSANATASGSPSVVLGPGTAAAHGFTGWSPETDTEANAYTVAAVIAGTQAPSTLTNNYTRADQRARG